MCRLYGVTRAGYYAWHNRCESERSKADKQLLVAIKEVHAASRGTYGSPRVFHVLRKRGFDVGKKRIERLMRENQIKARAQKIYKRHPEVQKFYDKLPKLETKASKPNQVWVGDITYLRANKQWHYLAVVMDKFSRKIVGWSFGKDKNSKLTVEALKNAAKKRKPNNGLIFHSDRGSEYLSHYYQGKAKRFGILQSSNRPRRMTDNAHMESFFHSLKSDEYHGRKFHSATELRRMIESYIPYYNQKRIHSGLGYQSPVEFEELIC
jgi:transposase InsO family protein